jgi:hypothetical protein
MFVVVYLVIGSVAFELVKTGHWFVGTALTVLLLCATTVKGEK